jgi:hypothetical protein
MLICVVGIPGRRHVANRLFDQFVGANEERRRRFER